MCHDDNAAIRIVDGDHFVCIAAFGPVESALGDRLPIDWGTPSGRAILDRRTIHIEDMRTVPEAEFPGRPAVCRSIGFRTGIAVPMLRDGKAVGTVIIRRMVVQPFTDREIALLESFANQAAIAVENARLIQDLQASNRKVTEALEQQTATAEVLRVIASSPTDVDVVLETIARTAAHLCDTDDASILRVNGQLRRLAAHVGPHSSLASERWARSMTRQSLAGL